LLPGLDLVTNGVPGLADPPSRLMVSAVAGTSAHGGGVSMLNTQVWASYYAGSSPGTYQATRIAVDEAGNVVVAGYANAQFATVKYAADGTALWTNRYAGPAVPSNDQVTDLTTDGLGNVLVAGYSRNANTNYDAVTIKYAPAGAGLWTNRFNDSLVNGATVHGLVGDAAGNAYVLVGNFFMVSGVAASTLVKYGPAGNVLWTRRYNAPANIEDNPAALAMTAAGDLVVACSSEGAGTGSDYAVLKYTSDGVCLWTNRYHRGFTDFVSSMAVDRSGNVIVTGDSQLPAPYLYPTVKYRSDGVALWTNLLPTPQYQGLVGKVTTDLSGNVFLSVGWPGATVQGDNALVKFDSTGTPLWTNRYVGLGAANGYLAAIGSDSAGNCYAAGYTMPPGGSHNAGVLARYSSDGRPVWTNRFDSPPGGDALAFALAISPSGSIYIAGEADFSNRVQFATVKFADYILYTPPASFSGYDEFAFTVTDSAGNRVTNVIPVAVLPLPPKIVLQPIPGNGSGGFGIRVTGAADGQAVVLYASTNLVHWQSVATNQPSQGACEFLDSDTAPGLRRFYRAAQ
jgi:hypothetical protein